MSEFEAVEKRVRPSWDEFFMNVALTVAERTACIFHKAGAVFVSEDNRIISVGYNGPTTKDYHCIEVGCAKVHGDPVTGEIRRCRGIHGEINAIINAGDTRKLKNATLYCTLFPCFDCMKALNNLGIKRIVYHDEYLRIVEGADGTVKQAEPEARDLATRRGIICEQLRPKNQKSEFFNQEDSIIIKEKNIKRYNRLNSKTKDKNAKNK